MASILIIGGGVAGLSAGIYLEMMGESATICEKLPRPGGNLTGWVRDGHTIDNCLHWLTGTNPVTGLYKVWTDLGALGRGVRMTESPSLFTCTWGGQTLSLWRDFERTVDEMLTISPADCREVMEFARAVDTFRHIQHTAGPGRDGREPTFKMVLSLPRLFRYHGITLRQLAFRFRHPLLRLFFTSIMSEDFSALAFIMTVAVYTGGNGDLPEGGSLAMARRMEARFTSLGGRLLTGKKAEKINLSDGRARSVTFSDGETLRADYVVVTPDPDTVFDGKMLNWPMPGELKKQYDSEAYARFSSYHCAYACDTADLPFHGDLIVEIPSDLRHDLRASHMMVRELSYLDHACPEGTATLQTMTLIPEETCLEFLSLARDPKAYRDRKAFLSDRVRKIIEDTCPSLRGRLRGLDVWTPATYRRYTGAAVGSFMSFVLPPKLLPRTLDNRIPGLENVVMATQWLQVPGGLPTAALSGKKAAEIIHGLVQGK